MTVIPPQIAKLIPRLASEHDGEVVATARAIERILKATGLDWHALAEQVDIPKPVYAAYGFDRSPSPTPRRRPGPQPPKPCERNWADMEPSEQIVWCDAILRYPSLDNETIIFVTDVRNKLTFEVSFHLEPRETQMLTKLIQMLKAKGRAARR